MPAKCPHCGALLHTDKAKPAATCWMCTSPITRGEASGDAGPPTVALGKSKSQKRSGAFLVSKDGAPRTKSLALPSNKFIRLFVTSGLSRGKEIDLSRPLMTVGRVHGGADIEIDDPDVSRVHCAIEVRRDVILLQDLRSTNGTYVDDVRVFTAQLEPMSAFRIGTSILEIRILSKSDLGKS